MSQKNYPRWLYHKSESAKIVHNEAEEASLGGGWAESPADCEQSPVEQQVETQAEAKPKRKTKKDAE